MKEAEFYEQLLSLPNLSVDRVEWSSTVLRIYCHSQSGASQCPHCLSSTSKVHQTHERQVGTYPYRVKKYGSILPLVNLSVCDVIAISMNVSNGLARAKVTPAVKPNGCLICVANNPLAKQGRCSICAPRP